MEANISAETIWATISLKDQRELVVGSYCRPPDSGSDSIDDLESVLSFITIGLRGDGPLRTQCPMSILTSGPETWPRGPVGSRRSLHNSVSRVPACKASPRAKLEPDRY